MRREGKGKGRGGGEGKEGREERKDALQPAAVGPGCTHPYHAVQ